MCGPSDRLRPWLQPGQERTRREVPLRCTTRRYQKTSQRRPERAAVGWSFCVYLS